MGEMVQYFRRQRIAPLMWADQGISRYHSKTREDAAIGLQLLGFPTLTIGFKLQASKLPSEKVKQLIVVLIVKIEESSGRGSIYTRFIANKPNKLKL